MPYKDPEVRKQKAREAAARKRAGSSTRDSSSSSPGASSPTPPGGTQDIPPSPPPRREKKRKNHGEVSPEAVRSLHGIVDKAIVAASVLFLEPETRMTPEERAMIFMPLERMYLRRASVPEFSPDTEDLVAAGMGLWVYLTRVGAFNGIYRQLSHKPRPPKQPRAAYTGPAPGVGTPPDYGSNGGGVGGAAPRADGGDHQPDAPVSASVPTSGVPRDAEAILRDLAEQSYVDPGNTA